MFRFRWKRWMYCWIVMYLSPSWKNRSSRKKILFKVLKFINSQKWWFFYFIFDFSRFLNGLCRDSRCRYSHDLADHQIPICDYYLRMVCSDVNCKFLHVKYAAGVKPCRFFNRGLCKRGIEVTFFSCYCAIIMLLFYKISSNTNGELKNNNNKNIK